MPDNISQELFQAVENVLTKCGDLYVTAIRQQLLDKGNLASGKLYESVVFQVQHKDQIAVLEIFAEDYFKYVEGGRRAGSKAPPLEAIIRWIELRGIRPRGVPDSKHGLPRTKRQLAFLFARNIRTYGIRPLNSLPNTNAKYKNQLFIDCGDALSAKTAEIIAREFEDGMTSKNIKVTTKYK